jgi:hypothetical protein
MPENASAPVSAPVSTSAPAPSAPSSSGFQQPEGAHSASEIFRQFEEQVGMSDEKGPDFKDARQWKDGDVNDLLSFGEEVDPTTGKAPAREDQMPSNEDGTDGLYQDPTELDDNSIDYTFEGKLGDKDHKIQFKTREQLDLAIKKAIVSDRLYKDNKTLRTEMESYKQDREYARNMDDYLENRPMELMDMIMEDLPEEHVKDWLLQKAEWYGQDQEIRRQAQVQKENELLRRKLAAIEEGEARLQQQRQQTALEADKYVVQSWGSGTLSKLQSRIPEQYHGIVEKELRSTLLEARHRQQNNENVDIKMLDRIFARNMKPLMDLIGAKTNQSAVDREVGRAMDAKRQQNLTRVQTAASQAMSRTQQTPNRNKELEENPAKIFDMMIQGIEQGRFKLKA